MTTAQDMIQDAAEKIGVYAPGETITAADEARFLKVLNDMIDSWSNESLTCYAILEQSVPLQVAKQSYTIGTTGSPDVNATRPIRLIDGPGAAYMRDSNGNRYPVNVVPRDQWNLIWNLTSTTSNIPNTLFYDPQFPLGVLNVWPLYNGTLAMTMFFDSYLQLTEFANLQATVTLPPGYVKAIQDNLAIEAGPYFKPDNWVPSAMLMKAASDSKGNIKRSNLRPNVATFDKLLHARGGAVYNIYADSYR